MRYILSLAAVLFFTTLQAQASFGVVSGYNRSQTKYDVEVPEDAHTHINSWHVSGLLTLPLANRLKLNADFGFIQRGAACMPGWVNFNQDSELRLEYAQISTNISWDIIRLKRLTISGYLGAGGSHLLSANEQVEDQWSDNTIRREVDLGDDSRLNRMDLGANYGGYIKYRVGCGELVSRIGGYRGFRQVNKENFSQNRDFLLSLGYAQSF